MEGIVFLPQSGQPQSESERASYPRQHIAHVPSVRLRPPLAGLPSLAPLSGTGGPVWLWLEEIVDT